MDDNASAQAKLWEMIASVRALGDLGTTAAPDVAEVMHAELRRTIHEGTPPDGEKWKPRQEDGGRPLKNAADHLYVAAIKNTVYVRLVGIDAAHHRGVTRGRVRRQVIPAGTHIPDRMAYAIRGVLNKHFEREVSGG